MGRQDAAKQRGFDSANKTGGVHIQVITAPSLQTKLVGGLMNKKLQRASSE